MQTLTKPTGNVPSVQTTKSHPKNSTAPTFLGTLRHWPFLPYPIPAQKAGSQMTAAVANIQRNTPSWAMPPRNLSVGYPIEAQILSVHVGYFESSHGQLATDFCIAWLNLPQPEQVWDLVVCAVLQTRKTFSYSK